MKKMYNAPELECAVLSVDDILTESSSSVVLGTDNDTDGKFGAVQSIRNRV